MTSIAEERVVATTRPSRGIRWGRVALYVFLPTINGEISFQGRYLVPVWLLLLLSAYGIRFTRQHLDAAVMIGMLAVIVVVNLLTLASVYSA